MVGRRAARLMFRDVCVYDVLCDRTTHLRKLTGVWFGVSAIALIFGARAIALIQRLQ